MTRRELFQWALAAGIGSQFDLDRLLWIPGYRSYGLPPIQQLMEFYIASARGEVHRGTMPIMWRGAAAYLVGGDPTFKCRVTDEMHAIRYLVPTNIGIVPIKSLLPFTIANTGDRVTIRYDDRPILTVDDERWVK